VTVTTDTENRPGGPAGRAYLLFGLATLLDSHTTSTT
jgi:hypothetical protein